MLVGAISNLMHSRSTGRAGGADKRIEAYTGRRNLDLKPVEKKRKTSFLSGIKSAFGMFKSWVAGFVMPKSVQKVKSSSITAKLNRINEKLEELNDELQGVDNLEIRAQFDTIHARLSALETQVGLYSALSDHDLPIATPITSVPLSLGLSPTAPPISSLYSLAGTREDVTRASQTVRMDLAPHTRELMKDMGQIAEVVDARKGSSQSPRGIQEEKLRATLAHDPSLARRFQEDAILSPSEKKAVELIKEMTNRTLDISRQVTDVADVVFDVNRDAYLTQFQERLNMLKADPNSPVSSEYDLIQSNIKALRAEIDTIRNWVTSYQEVLAEMLRLHTEFGPYLSAEKDAIQIEIDTLMRKQHVFYTRLSHAELSLQGRNIQIATPI